MLINIHFEQFRQLMSDTDFSYEGLGGIWNFLCEESRDRQEEGDVPSVPDIKKDFFQYDSTADLCKDYFGDVASLVFELDDSDKDGMGIVLDLVEADVEKFLGSVGATEPETGRPLGSLLDVVLDEQSEDETVFACAQAMSYELYEMADKDEFAEACNTMVNLNDLRFSENESAVREILEDKIELHGYTLVSFRNAVVRKY